MCPTPALTTTGNSKVEDLLNYFATIDLTDACDADILLDNELYFVVLLNYFAASLFAKATLSKMPCRDCLCGKGEFCGSTGLNKKTLDRFPHLVILMVFHIFLSYESCKRLQEQAVKFLYVNLERRNVENV